MLDIIFQDSEKHYFLKDQDGVIWETVRTRFKFNDKWEYQMNNIPAVPFEYWLNYLYKGVPLPDEYIFDLE